MGGRARKTMKPVENGDKSLLLLVAVVWVGLLIVHANKCLNFYPLIIPDEYWYTSDLRLRPYAETAYPGYLYYLIYSVTGLFGERFLDAGRVLNAFFFMLSAPFLYKLARMSCSRNVSLFVALLVLVSPISSYTAYFMPESLYFTGFWALAWLIVSHAGDQPLRTWAAAGTGIAVLSLIKAHGLFLFPGYAFFLLLATPRASRSAYFAKAGTGLAGMTAALLIVRAGLGLAFAGTAGLNPFGANYTTFAAAGGGAAALPFLQGAAYCLAGHGIAVAVLFAPAAALALGFARRAPAGDVESGAPPRRLVLFTFCVMIPLVLVVCGFSSLFDATQDLGDIPEVARINMRYYNFVFPAFPLIAAGVLAGADGKAPAPAFRIPFALALAAGGYILLTSFRGYSLNAMPANPELGGLEYHPLLFSAGILLLTAVSALGMFRPILAGRLYLFGALPLIHLTAGVCIQIMATYGSGLFPDIYDKGGIYARDTLGEECSALTVVDGFYNNMTKALIHIDNPDVDMLPQFTPEADVGQVKPGKRWLLVFGGIRVPERHVESQTVYLDPAITPEMMEIMRARNDYRALPRYALVKLRGRP